MGNSQCTFNGRNMKCTKTELGPPFNGKVTVLTDENSNGYIISRNMYYYGGICKNSMSGNGTLTQFECPSELEDKCNHDSDECKYLKHIEFLKSNNHGYVHEITGYWDNNKIILGEGAWLEDDYLYKGKFINNDVTNGTITHANGNIYTGEFNDGDLTNGTITYVNGNVFTGEFINGDLANGTITYTNGNVYTGEFVDNKHCGNGIFTKPDGTHLSGRFNKSINSCTGEGVWFYEGNKYEGKFVDGRLTNGTITYANGDIYTGECTDDKPHGNGILTKITGEVKNGVFVKGELLSSHNKPEEGETE